VKRLVLMIAVLASAAYVGCKQADGDRCQVDDDCASGLCNKAKGTCAAGADNKVIDGAIVIDAPPDTPTITDASTDTMADAP
jgi:hypothetical protein